MNPIALQLYNTTEFKVKELLCSVESNKTQNT